MKREVEDWLTELPPLDGDDDDAAVDVDTADDIEPATEHDSLDDAASDDLDVSDDAPGDDSEGEDGPPAGAGDDAWSADVGEPELDTLEDEPEGDETLDEGTIAERAVEDADLDIDDEHGTGDDAGEEGTSEPVEHALEGDLPPLDADDEGDFEDALIADALDALESPSASDALRWADAVWKEAPTRSRPLTWSVDESDPVSEVCSRGPARVLAVSAAGDLWAADGERVALTTFASLQAAAGGPLTPPLVVAMADIGQAAWLVDQAGRVLRSVDGGFTWHAHGGVQRTALAAAARENALMVLVAEGTAARVLTSHDGAQWFAQGLALALQAGAHSRLWFALSAGAVAVGDDAGVWLARDGQSFTRVQGSRGATAGTFAGASANAALIMAVPAQGGDGGTHLVRVDDRGAVDIIAHLAQRVGSTEEDDDELRPHHMHWDDEHRALFVAFRSAIVACVPPAGSRG